MSGVTITNLPAAISLSGTEMLEAVQAGSSVRITVAQLWASIIVSSNSSPVTESTTARTILSTDYYLILTNASTTTLTLGTATAGRVLQIKTTASATTVSASSNVTPLAGGAAGTAILSGTPGKWAKLVGNGSNWVIMAAN